MNNIQAPPALALHASAALTPGGALLFLGHAGAGKSTAVHLLAERFSTLADDAVLLLPQPDGTWQVACGDRTVFGGRAAVEAATGLDWVPLRAVLRLFQAPEPRLVPILPRETCRHLMDAAFEITWQQRLRPDAVRGMFSSVARLARAIPGWEMHLSTSPVTSDLVAEALV